MAKKKIFLITSSRADYGIMLPLIRKLDKSSTFSFELIVTGAHFSREFGYSLQHIKKEKFKKVNYIKLNGSKKNKHITVTNISEGLKRFNKFFYIRKPNLICIPCDRSEMLGPALAAHTNNIPIAHFHGGETSLGSQDEATRHCLTKISSLHFVSNNVHKKRVIQLGEQPSTVHNVGNLSCENINATKILNKNKLEKVLKIRPKSTNILFTFHPITNDPETTKKELGEILKAFRLFKKKINLFVTYPNSDYGKNEVIKYIYKIKKIKNIDIKIFKNLGNSIYYSLIKYVNCVVGNSSSGLVEVPFLGTQSIMIGVRQKGRYYEQSVINIKANKKIIFSTITKAIKGKKKKKKDIKKINSPSKKILNEIKKFDYKKRFKKFYDIKFK